MASYVPPLPRGGTFRRYDQGIDYQGHPFDPVVAIGRARVDAVKDDPGGFGKAVYYTLLDGPAKGTQIYVGHALPLVRPGQIVKAGGEIAALQKSGLGNASGLAGWVEIGIAKNGAPAFSAPTGGQAFANLLKATSPNAPAPTQNAPSSAPASPAPIDTSQETFTGAEPPSPDTTQPLLLPPGVTLPSSAPAYLAQLWQQIASQAQVSPDTLAYAQNAAIAGG